MPTWELHNRWAMKLGILDETNLNFVNLLIDMPSKHKEFLEFCEQDPEAKIFKKGKPTSMNVGAWITHDLARKKEFARKIQLRFLSKYSSKDLTKAFYLHQTLDYIEWWLKKSELAVLPKIEEILSEKHVIKKLGSLQDIALQEVLIFVKANAFEVFEDILKE